MEKRTCRICGETKPLDKYEIDKRYKSGHRTNRCNACKSASSSVANKAFLHLKERAAKEGRKVEISRKEIEMLFSFFEACPYCGIKQSESDEVFHIDHLIARSANGRDHISNLIVCCAKCNRTKNAKPLAVHFFSDERFKDSNFATLAHYIAFMSGQPVEEIVKDIANQYAIHELRKERMAIEREAKSG